MARELITLDPPAVADGRTELALHPTTGTGPILVRPEGPDWGDADIAAYMAELERGEVAVDFRISNRQVKIPLTLQTAGGVTFEQARERLQQKVGLFQREGGWLKRQFRNGRVLYLDVVKATLGMGGGTMQAQHDIDNDVDLVLETLPDWYGDEITLDQVSETTKPELVTVLKEVGVDAVIKGDYPGRVRVVVDELDADDQFGLLWGFRARHYSAASTAKLEYEAEALDPLDAAAVATLSGASGGATNNVVEHADLSTNWTPVLGTNVGGTTHLTHVGTYRVFARMRSPNGDAVKARLVWSVGDLASPVENDPWQFPAASELYIADVGEVRLDRVPVGSQRWRGHVQAKGSAGGERIQIDKLWFLPIDESAGRARAPFRVLGGLVDYQARDEFNQVAGGLNNVAAPVGGNWATAGGAGDYSIEATGHTAQRTQTNDAAGYQNGRFALLGPSTTNLVCQVAAKVSTVDVASYVGLVARYVNIDNWWLIRWNLADGDVEIAKHIAGTLTSVKLVTNFRFVEAATWATLRLMIDAGGRWFAWFPRPGGPMLVPDFFGQDPVLATGGALASGQCGIWDYHQSTTATTRNFDNFFVAAPTRDAALFASQSAELRTDGLYRETADGTAYGRMAHRIGDLPRIPPSGLEGRPVELFLKASRGDLDIIPDTGIDDIRAQVFYRPSWLFAPGA